MSNTNPILAIVLKMQWIKKYWKKKKKVLEENVKILIVAFYEEAMDDKFSILNVFFSLKKK